VVFKGLEAGTRRLIKVLPWNMVGGTKEVTRTTEPAVYQPRLERSVDVRPTCSVAVYIEPLRNVCRIRYCRSL
jgi:hypothetical protein